MASQSHKATLNEVVTKTFFSDAFQDATMTLSFNRRDIIEGYMTGKLPFDDLVSNLDLHSGYSGLKVKFFKTNGVVTHTTQIYLKSGEKHV